MKGRQKFRAGAKFGTLCKISRRRQISLKCQISRCVRNFAQRQISRKCSPAFPSAAPSLGRTHLQDKQGKKLVKITKFKTKLKKKNLSSRNKNNI